MKPSPLALQLLLGPNFRLRTMFSNPFSLRSSLFKVDKFAENANIWMIGLQCLIQIINEDRREL